MTSFSDYSSWGFLNLFAILSLSLLAANLLKKNIKWLRHSLIPTSVIGGLLLLLFSFLYEKIADVDNFFNIAFFGGTGSTQLELLTYHCLALGFIASAFKPSREKLNKKRSMEIFNTGLTTVSCYLLQAILGLIVTISCGAYILKGSGTLLCFGYGQGTGQAMNYGSIYETEYGMTGGASVGLTIAAVGFISAGIGGVLYLHYLRKRHLISVEEKDVTDAINHEQIQSPDEIPMNASIDKMTIQISIISATYILAYVLMCGLGALVPSLKSTIFGLNFLVGVLMATLVKGILRFMERKKIVKKKYINPFLMQRISNFMFDIMIVAGVAAIRLEMVKQYWWILIILCSLGTVATFLYNRFIAGKLFPEYKDEQFLVMYGMLTGTASTGVILLREKDTNFVTPALDNLVYQNLPAIVFGFPMMILATVAPQMPLVTLFSAIGYFIVLNLILFRHFIIKRKPKA